MLTEDGLVAQVLTIYVKPITGENYQENTAGWTIEIMILT